MADIYIQFLSKAPEHHIYVVYNEAIVCYFHTYTWQK